MAGSRKSRKRHNRKARRGTKAVLRHGPSAKARHRSKSGRTGNVWFKRKGRIRFPKDEGQA